MAERLTHYDESGRVYSSRGYEITLARLAAYEDTGLEPEEIENIIERGTPLEGGTAKLMKQYLALGTVEELAALKERTRWVPVSEKLPDSEAAVLAITKQFGVAVSRYHRSLNYPQFDSGWFCQSQRVSVAHWMPLPEAQKEADHAD